MGDGPIDPAQRRLAERRLLAALRRHQRREPLRVDVRVDALIAEMRDAEPSRPSGHRGRQPLTLSDADLRAVMDGLVTSGMMLRQGHRVRLPVPPPPLDQIMRERVDRLLAALRVAGSMPPPAEGVARRLGIPDALIIQLRATGDLVSVAPRIDFPRETWAEISGQLDGLAAGPHLSVRVVRDELRTTRRHAEAILRRRERRPATP